MRKHRTKVGGVIAVALFAGLTLPVLFGEPRIVDGSRGGDRWRNTIYDFQTLIAGILAVAAAFVTVRQMQITDEAAENRHSQLVQLSLRPDRLRIERVIMPYENEFLLRTAVIESILDELTTYRDGEHAVGLPRFQELIDKGKFAAKLSQEIIAMLAAKDWQEALPLFGGRLTKRVREASDAAKWLVEDVEALSPTKLIETDFGLVEERTRHLDELMSALFTVTGSISLLRAALVQLRIGLDELACEYGISRPKLAKASSLLQRQSA